MHHAPPVSCRVGRSFFEAGLCAGLSLLLGFLLLVALQVWQGAHGHKAVLLLAAWAGVTVWSVVRWWRTPVRVLTCSGGQWALDERPGTVTACQDWSGLLLLEWRDQSNGQRIYLWLTKTAYLNVWSDLRRALYSAPTITAPLR